MIQFDLNLWRKLNKLCKESQQFGRLLFCGEFDWCLFNSVSPNCRVNPVGWCFQVVWICFRDPTRVPAEFGQSQFCLHEQRLESHSHSHLQMCCLPGGKTFYQKKKQKSQINYLRSHCLWRVFPRKSDEIKNLTELSYSLLLVFHVHRIGQLLNLERHDRHKLQEKITVTETWKPEKITSPLSSSFTPQNLWPSIIWKPHWPMLYILRIISYCDWYFQHICCPER